MATLPGRTLLDLAEARDNHGIFYTQPWSFLDIHMKIEQTTIQGVR